MEASLTIAPVSLDIGFAKLKVDVGGVIRPYCIYRTASLFQSLTQLDRGGLYRDQMMHALGTVEGEQIREIFQRVTVHNNSTLDLSRVVELLIELKDLPIFSPLQILGYFAVLESVLTHQPKPDDRYESITRQITQKLALLNKRWHPALDYSALGSGASHEKIWPKMYAYRSAIAHGTKPDFKSQSQLALLKNENSANVLIKDTVKKVICQAYAEPQLMRDLHDV